jgi:purine-binding chemotaxis protein CheW
MSLTGQLVVCALGAEQYGLPIDQVQEIVRYVEPRPIATDDDAVRGVIALRGRLLPVHDLLARLGIGSPAVVGGPDAGPAAPPPGAKIVVVEVGEELAGLIVDDVVEVATIAAEQVEEVPAAASGGRPASVAKLGERLVLLLDAEALLDAAPAPATAAPAQATAPPATAPASTAPVPG